MEETSSQIKERRRTMTTETSEITNTQDCIDSRNIEERIKYLEEQADKEEHYTGEHEDEKEELQKLKALKEAVGDDENWEFGITFIAESYFEDYAREFAEDIGAIKKDGEWPTNCIDWESAANELKIDFSEVDFDGETYYYRN